LIKDLKHEGRWVEEPREVKDITQNFFSSKFSFGGEILDNIGLENIPFKCLSNKQRSSLMQADRDQGSNLGLWGLKGTRIGHFQL